MNTKINLTYNGVTYTLEYNRMTVKMLEKAGFVISEFMEQPMNNIELAFTAAFVKNHPNIKQEIIDEIFNNCTNKTNLVGALSQMINECYDSLLAEPTKEGEDDSGNAHWEIVDLKPTK